MRLSLVTALFIGIFPLSAPPAMAQQDQARTEHSEHATHQTAVAAVVYTEGTVKKVDRAAGKVTIKHGPLVNQDMPAMTMVFRVAEPAWIEQLKPNDTIRFVADKVNGMLTVTTLKVVAP